MIFLVFFLVMFPFICFRWLRIAEKRLTNHGVEISGHGKDLRNYLVFQLTSPNLILGKYIKILCNVTLLKIYVNFIHCLF